ncbi:alkaline phosphatase family protein [Nonomuraea sp. NPDC046802]|uniref:alkaline phosphatase family protein n=1 Tax=Nonomuraea sp. NPDC046802 TaxID=3154919 RepID=UPI0033EC0426
MSVLPSQYAGHFFDYVLQRYGPSDPRAAAAAAELDTVLTPLLGAAEAQGGTVVCLPEYGITDVRHPVDVNRMLRAEGLLRVHTQDGMEPRPVDLARSTTRWRTSGFPAPPTCPPSPSRPRHADTPTVPACLIRNLRSAEKVLCWKTLSLTLTLQT